MDSQLKSKPKTKRRLKAFEDNVTLSQDDTLDTERSDLTKNYLPQISKANTEQDEARTPRHSGNLEIKKDRSGRLMQVDCKAEIDPEFAKDPKTRGSDTKARASIEEFQETIHEVEEEKEASFYRKKGKKESNAKPCSPSSGVPKAKIREPNDLNRGKAVETNMIGKFPDWKEDKPVNNCEILEKSFSSEDSLDIFKLCNVPEIYDWAVKEDSGIDSSEDMNEDTLLNELDLLKIEEFTSERDIAVTQGDDNKECYLANPIEKPDSSLRSQSDERKKESDRLKDYSGRREDTSPSSRYVESVSKSPGFSERSPESIAMRSGVGQMTVKTNINNLAMPYNFQKIPGDQSLQYPQFNKYLQNNNLNNSSTPVITINKIGNFPYRPTTPHTQNPNNLNVPFQFIPQAYNQKFLVPGQPHGKVFKQSPNDSTYKPEKFNPSKNYRRNRLGINEIVCKISLSCTSKLSNCFYKENLKSRIFEVVTNKEGSLLLTKCIPNLEPLLVNNILNELLESFKPIVFDLNGSQFCRGFFPILNFYQREKVLRQFTESFQEFLVCSLTVRLMIVFFNESNFNNQNQIRSETSQIVQTICKNLDFIMSNPQAVSVAVFALQKYNEFALEPLYAKLIANFMRYSLRNFPSEVIVASITNGKYLKFLEPMEKVMIENLSILCQDRYGMNVVMSGLQHFTGESLINLRAAIERGIVGIISTANGLFLIEFLLQRDLRFANGLVSALVTSDLMVDLLRVDNGIDLVIKVLSIIDNVQFRQDMRLKLNQAFLLIGDKEVIRAWNTKAEKTFKQKDYTYNDSFI